jgi:hypothetical protein
MNQMTNQIIDCNGKYEVHAGAKGGYAVVNSETGEVRCSFATEREAVKVATKLNSEAAE